MPLLFSAEQPCFRDAAPGEGEALASLFTYHLARKSSQAPWGPVGSWGWVGPLSPGHIPPRVLVL